MKRIKMSRVDENEAARSNKKKALRGRRKKIVRKTKSTRKKKPSKRSKPFRRLPQQVRPTAPLLSDSDSDYEVPILDDLGGIVSSVVKPILRPLSSVLQIPFGPSTPENSDDESEPPVPLRLESLSGEEVPKAIRAPPPVPPRKDAVPKPPPRRKKPARRSSAYSRKQFEKSIARKAQEALGLSRKGLTAMQVIDLAAAEGFEWDNPFLGKKQETLAAVEYLERQGLVVELGTEGWDIYPTGEYNNDSNDSDWDYGPKLRF